MDATPESKPEPKQTSVPPPGASDGQGGRGRKILGSGLAAVVVALPAWLAVFILLEIVLQPSGPGHDWQKNLWPQTLLAALVAVGLAAGVVRMGLKRGFYERRGSIQGLGIGATIVLAAAIFTLVTVRRIHLHDQIWGVFSNAHQLSAAADQYFLENGVSTVDMANLVGSSNYVKALNSVADETYPQYYTQGVTMTIAGVAGAHTVTYEP